MDKQLISDLVANKSEHIRLKKAITKYCDSFKENETTTKAVIYDNKDDIENGVITRKIVANTYNWMDSHSDVHIDGLFSKSISENKERIMHLHDHIYQLGAKVGKIINIEENTILWSDLGVNKQGYTTSLIIESEIKKALNEQIYTQYLGKEINQHSVGMQYVNISLCVNDTEYKEEYANWMRYINKVGNIEKAIEQGYFWAVTEAKLIEVSCVIAGSNELTPTLEPTTKETETKEEPLNEPSNDTQKENTQIDYNYLLKNLNL